MKPKMRIVLVAEDKLSIGRWLIIIAIFGLLLGSSLTLIPDALNGKIYHYDQQTWGFTFFGIGFFIFMMILGAIAHRRTKWPKFVTEVYPDGWIRELLISADGTPRRVSNDILPDLIVATKYDRYKKKYSKKKKMWYIRWFYSLYHERKIYLIIHYGWLKEPILREFENFVNELNKLGEKNSKGKNLKVSFFDVVDVLEWNKLDYSKKLKEEREKLISGENEEEK